MLIELIEGTLSILLTFLVLTAAFTGVGLMSRRLLAMESLGLDDLFLAFWVGYGLAILFLILWNFFLPVTGYALVVVLVVGTFGLLQSRSVLRSVFDAEPWRPGLLFFSLAVLAGLYTANLSMGPFESWDGGLYHLQAVKWAANYPVVPGIANLHGPLAFNNSSFLYGAMLDSGPWEGRAYHLSNGLLTFVMLLTIIANGARLQRAHPQQRPCLLFGLLLLTPTMHLVLDGRIRSYITDVPTTFVLLAAAMAMYRLLRRKQEPDDNGYLVFALAVLLSTATCLKLSMGVYAALAMPPVLIVWCRRRYSLGVSVRRTAALSVLVVGLFASAWIARGIVMSGYPLFPSSFAGLSVDWRAPMEHADAEVANIYYTEREFAWSTGDRWIRHVTKRNPYAILGPSIIISLSLLIWLTRALAQRNGTWRARAAAWWMLLPSLGAIALWFVTAPAPRYAVPMFWSLAALSVCQLYAAFGMEQKPKSQPWILAGCVLLGLSPPIVEPTVRAIQGGRDPARALLDANFVKPGPDLWFHPITEQPVLTEFLTESGLLLNVPMQLEDRFSKPWDAPLPSTPNPASNLRLRVPGELGGGFVVDGEWQMQDWPYYWRGDWLERWRQSRTP